MLAAQVRVLVPAARRKGQTLGCVRLWLFFNTYPIWLFKRQSPLKTCNGTNHTIGYKNDGARL